MNSCTLKFEQVPLLVSLYCCSLIVQMAQQCMLWVWYVLVFCTVLLFFWASKQFIYVLYQFNFSTQLLSIMYSYHCTLRLYSPVVLDYNGRVFGDFWQRKGYHYWQVGACDVFIYVIWNRLIILRVTQVNTHVQHAEIDNYSCMHSVVYSIWLFIVCNVNSIVTLLQCVAPGTWHIVI